MDNLIDFFALVQGIQFLVNIMMKPIVVMRMIVNNPNKNKSWNVIRNTIVEKS